MGEDEQIDQLLKELSAPTTDTTSAGGSSADASLARLYALLGGSSLGGVSAPANQKFVLVKQGDKYEFIDNKNYDAAKQQLTNILRVGNSLVKLNDNGTFGSIYTAPGTAPLSTEDAAIKSAQVDLANSLKKEREANREAHGIYATNLEMHANWRQQQAQDATTTNANTAAQQAATADRREDRLTTLAEKQADALAKNNALRELEIRLDNEVKLGSLSRQDAQLEYTKAWNQVVAAQKDVELEIRRQSEERTAKTAEGQLRQGDERLGFDKEKLEAENQRAGDTLQLGRETLDETRRGHDLSFTGGVLGNAVSLGNEASRAMTASLPFQAPIGTAEDLAATRTGILRTVTPDAPEQPARAQPFHFNPATVGTQTAAAAAQAMSPLAMLIAQAVSQRAGGSQGFAAPMTTAPVQ